MGLGLVSYPASLAAQTARPAAVPAKSSQAPDKSGQLTVDDIVKLVGAQVPEAVILKKLRDNGRALSPTADQMIALKKAGASETLLITLMDPAFAPKTAPAGESASAPAPPPPPPAAAIAPVPPPPPSQPAGVPAPASANRRRLMVVDFDYSAVKTAVQQIFKQDQDIGRGLRAMMVTRIVQADKLAVVERAKMDVLLKEQDLGMSNRMKRGTTARIGQIKGADAILMGDIVVFGRDDSKKKSTFGGVVGRVWNPKLGAVFDNWKKEEKAVVVVNYRLVDAETSEVITTGEARGESSRKSGGWGSLLAVPDAAGGAGMSVESSNFAQTIIGEAALDCANKLGEILNQSVPKMAAHAIQIESRVADASGAELILAAGSNDGVKAGDRFSIERIEKEVRDPNTKEVIDIKTRRIGDLVITGVRERTATGSFSGSEASRVGDAAIKL